jgi:pSer/pThr/pTyr-binding forkhead associated (FHA) protein
MGMVKFSVSYNNKVIKTYELDDDVITIGRLPENKICISNMGISRRHSKIERDTNNKLVIIDLNSLNGTIVNNKKAPKAFLSPGDTITIGKYIIVLESDDKNETTAQPIAEEATKSPQPERPPMAQSVEESSPQIPKNTPITASEPPNNSAASGAVLIETTKHVVYKLDKKLITLGASETNDIFISGFLVGDGRIEIERNGRELCIKSHKFLGKFKVNGRKTKSHVLQHKDRIEIGSSVFRFMES